MSKKGKIITHEDIMLEIAEALSKDIQMVIGMYTKNINVGGEFTVESGYSTELRSIMINVGLRINEEDIKSAGIYEKQSGKKPPLIVLPKRRNLIIDNEGS